MWNLRPWFAGSNAVAIRNAKQASVVLARRRTEREEVGAFLATFRTVRPPAGASSPITG